MILFSCVRNTFDSAVYSTFFLCLRITVVKCFRHSAATTVYIRWLNGLAKYRILNYISAVIAVKVYSTHHRVNKSWKLFRFMYRRILPLKGICTRRYWIQQYKICAAKVKYILATHKSLLYARFNFVNQRIYKSILLVNRLLTLCASNVRRFLWVTTLS